MTSIYAGVLAALGAGICWGLVFIAPLLLANYPPYILAFGRYLAFGLITLPIAAASWNSLKKLNRSDWWSAARLSLVGNIIYYCGLAAAIQLAGAPSISALIGTLPIVIAIAANLSSNKGSETTIAWSRLSIPLLIIAVGLMMVNYRELLLLKTLSVDGSANFYWGLAIGLIALAAWTWYPIKNAQWLKANTQHSSQTWASAQGLTTLPLAAIGYLLSGVLHTQVITSDFNWPLGPTPGYFIGLMLILGLTASWLGTVLWNFASGALPGALSGQLIVFETLAALVFAYCLRGQWPELMSAIGIGLLVVGVIAGIRLFR